uniref:Uncharacterized protein n=1 Tax=Oryza brachyantha TaxID=4533 RepID=J3M4G1_ORYBR
MPSSPVENDNGAAYFDFRAAECVPESHAWMGMHEKDAAPVVAATMPGDEQQHGDDAVPIVYVEFNLLRVS